MLRSLVGSEMCIRDRVSTQSTGEKIKAEREAWAQGDDGSADDPLSTFKDEDLIGVPRRKTTLELRRDKRLGKDSILPDEWKPMRNGEEVGSNSGNSTSLLKSSGPTSSSGNLLSSSASRSNVGGARAGDVSRETATKSFTNPRGTVVRDKTTYRDENGVERVEENSRFEPNPSYSRAPSSRGATGGNARRRPMSGGLGGLPADGHRPPSAARTRTPTSRGGGGQGSGAAPYQPSTFAQRLENSPYHDPQPGRVGRPSSSPRGKQRPLPSSIEGQLDEIHRYEHDQRQRDRRNGGGNYNFLPSRATLELASDVGRQHRTFANLQDQLDYEEDLNAAVWELEDVNMASLERIRELETTLSRFDRIARQSLHMGI
eukprot:TRINITY_DN14297_c0_g1_i3.p1 TRINITY_DN14297_c0_g1~~TRINITY_DN14297_c0_g1_i3.p1  ORF type:complete len:373 (-),score=65.02 TRINITY_DN14297_c0_g1_i3:194-1312(-)